MSKIQIIRGSYNETCVASRNLTENQVKAPQIRDVIEYAEQRMLSTLIVSGAKSDRELGYIPTKIGTIPKDKTIGSSGYRYKIQGRIQQASVILSQVGTTTSDNIFQLVMKDNYLVPGMVARFHGERFHARVMTAPSGSANNWIYTFQGIGNTLFSMATHVNGQQGAKTCFGSFTAYGEKSQRGFGRSHFPDEFINHISIQRKTIAMSGDALTDVLWYHYKGKSGWLFEQEVQSRIIFKMEDEYLKWFGQSTMKNADGTLRERSQLIDAETSEEIIIGDGVYEQISGGNEAEGSGANGEITLDDITDMMTTLEKKSNTAGGKQWYIVTGTDGANRCQTLFGGLASGNFNLTINQNGSNKIGGPDVQVGYNFNTYNVNGNQVIVVKHPLFDDEARFTERGADGKLLQSSEMIFLDLGEDMGRKNMEILSKGAYGINRSMVSAYLEGLTGRKGMVTSSVDAMEYNMLKQDGIFIYNTSSCGILRKRKNA